MRLRSFCRGFGLSTGLALTVAACGSDTPTAPTPVPIPPPALSIACPINATGTSVLSQPVMVTWADPTTSGGQAPVVTTCTPASGSTFAIGTTSVTCRANDSALQSTACSFSVVIAAAPKLSVTTFMAFGDSITQGVGSPAAPFGIWELPDWPLAYPYKLRDLLTARYTDQSIKVWNDGWWGEFIEDGLARLPSEIRYYQPEVLLLLEGANDLASAPSEATTKYIAGRLQDMIHAARLQKPKIEIMLATFPPQYAGGTPDRGVGAPYVSTLNGEIAKVATTNGVILVDLYRDFAATGTRLIGVDGLHPTDAGFTQMAKSFYTAIQANLEVKAATVQIIPR